MLEDRKKIPPFPKDFEKKRTPFGTCLVLAFAVGEWQKKCLDNASHQDWSDAEWNAKGIIQREDELEKYCGVDVRRPKFYMERVLSAIEKKDYRKLENVIGWHDTEILTAMAMSEGKCSI